MQQQLMRVTTVPITATAQGRGTVLSPPQILTLLVWFVPVLSVVSLYCAILLKAILNCRHGLGPLVAG